MNAADEAARRFPNDMGHGSTNGPGALTSASFPIKLRRGDFAAGAAWQRSQPIEVTDAMVQAAVKEISRYVYPKQVRAALTAALNTMKDPNQ